MSFEIKVLGGEDDSCSGAHNSALFETLERRAYPLEEKKEKKKGDNVNSICPIRSFACKFVYLFDNSLLL